MKKGMVGVVAAVSGALAGALGIGRVLGKQLSKDRDLRDKHMALFQMMIQWIKVKQSGKNLSSYFEQEGFKEIAIYGMHFAGEILAEELYGTDIDIKYGIDRNADKIYADFDIVKPESELEKVDVIVVTAITFFKEIEEMLNQRVDCPVISLEDILYLV